MCLQKHGFVAMTHARCVVKFFILGTIYILKDSDNKLIHLDFVVRSFCLLTIDPVQAIASA